MKLFTRFSVATAIALCVGLSASAASDYPDFYLRGDFPGGSWMTVAPEFTFSRAGSVYSYHIDELNGRFKISNDDWAINFGGEYGADPAINSAVYIKGVSDGLNFEAKNLKDVTISFEYDPNNNYETLIKICANGEEPQLPPEPVLGSGTLPVLYINVYDEYGKLDNEIISKDLDHKNYFSGNYWLDLNGCEWMEAEGAKSIGCKEEPLPLQIKARGNWTRKGFSKKPFKLKLDKKQSLLGLSKSKHFAILAHADDNLGYLRNFTGFNLGRRMELPWTPDQQPVEVVINGDYRGLYFLTESIRIDTDRVNITELEDLATDPTLISGGYLVELDNYDEDNQIRMEEKGQAYTYRDLLRITFDTPEEYSDIQRKFVGDQFTAMNDAIGDNSDVLWSYMDLDDAARYYIVEEIISHTESYHGSTYLFRDRGENQKWHFSPLWDFGNAFNGPTNDYFYYHGPFGNTWIASMRMNAKFNDKVKETWKWFMSNKFDGIYDDMDLISNRLKAAAQADYERWNGQPVPYGGQSVSDNRDMDAKVNEAKSHLEHKINWLKNQWGNFSGYYAEPARDTTPAAPLPEYVTTDINEIESITDGEGPVEIYNLQGFRVREPKKGEIYIIRSSSKAQKAILK